MNNPWVYSPLSQYTSNRWSYSAENIFLQLRFKNKFRISKYCWILCRFLFSLNIFIHGLSAELLLIMLFGSALRAFTIRYGKCDDLENIEKIYDLRWWYTGSAPQEQCLKPTQYLPQPSTVVLLETYHPYFTFYTFLLLIYL